MSKDDHWEGYTGLDELKNMVVLGADFEGGDGWIKGAEIIDGYRRAVLHDAAFDLTLYDPATGHTVEILVQRAALNLESRAATEEEKRLGDGIRELNGETDGP